MCLSTVYMRSGGGEQEIMRDVARIEAEGNGFWLVTLFGAKKFIEGTVQSIDLYDDHFVMFAPPSES